MQTCRRSAGAGHIEVSSLSKSAADTPTQCWSIADDHGFAKRPVPFAWDAPPGRCLRQPQARRGGRRR